MEYPCDCKRLPYHGWEIRSYLTQVSLEGTVAAGEPLFFGEVCVCHIVSCKQFANSDERIVSAMELVGGSNAYATA